MDLKDKVILITGSSSGIGKTTAIRFAKEGAKIVVNCRENVKGGEETVEEIKNLGGEAILVQADVSKPDDVKHLFDEAVEKFGTVDILINNAAYPAERVPFFEAKQEDIMELMNTNVISTMLCSQRAVEIMKQNGGGKIMNTSSIKGWEHGGNSITYAVSKAAVNSFTRTLAKHVAVDNICVNAVAPGYVKTRIYNTKSTEKVEKWSDTYLKRWITEEEIADAFVFLAKNDAMTGQVIYVDGGFTLK